MFVLPIFAVAQKAEGGVTNGKIAKVVKISGSEYYVYVVADGKSGRSSD